MVGVVSPVELFFFGVEGAEPVLTSLFSLTASVAAFLAPGEALGFLGPPADDFRFGAAIGTGSTPGLPVDILTVMRTCNAKNI